MSSFYVDKKDNVYVGTSDNGLLKISPKGLIVKEQNKVTSNSVFFKEMGNQLVTFNQPYDEKETLVYHFRNQLIKIDKNFAIRSKAFLIKEEFICFNTVKGIVLYNLLNVNAKSEIQYKTRVTSFQIIDNLVFVGLETGGLKIYSELNGTLTEQHHFLKQYTCTSITKDKAGGYWFSTTQQGVFYTPNLDVLSYSTANGLHKNFITELGKMGNQLTISFGEEYQVFDGHSFSPLQKMEDELLINARNKTQGFLQKQACIFYHREFKLFDDCKKFSYPNRKTSGMPVLEKVDDALYFFI